MRTFQAFAAGAAALSLLAACSPPANEAAAPPPAAAPAPAVETPAPAEPAATVEPVALEIKGADGAALSGDPAKGARVFRQCQSCHVVEAGVNRVGPSLHGIIGRTAGSVEGFNYSPANKASGIVWTQQEMFDYLENPKAKIPNTTMAFLGLKQPQDRADVIAYLITETK